jgi:hypothetical protein
VSTESKLLPHDERAIQRLQRMIDRTQGIADALANRIPIETSVADRARLEFQLREAEEHIAALLQRLQDATARDPRERLHSALIRLDFEDQMRIYRKLTIEKRLGAFVVLPEPPKQAEHVGIAVGLLVTRLLRALPDHINITPLKMSFRRRVRNSGTDALWRELANLVGLPRSAERRDVVAGVVEKLKTQHVVILLTDLDDGDLDDCIDPVWAELAGAVTQAQPARSLVLVLIDLDGETRASTSSIPARLWIRPLSKDDISLWFRALADDCPFRLLDEHETVAHEIIAAASEHNPDGVLEGICARSEWNCPEFRLDDWFRIYD